MCADPQQPDAPSSRGKQIRVVVLGGGAGGLSAAFWLTSTQELRERYKVTVYTRGWRLGGKGASGRNVDKSQRIEEHGLHMWLGCYQNAFRTIRCCYEAWEPNEKSPIKNWNDGFTAVRQIVLEEQEDPPQAGIGCANPWFFLRRWLKPARASVASPRSWEPWVLQFPPRPGEPGDAAESLPKEFFHALVNWLDEHLRKVPAGRLQRDHTEPLARVREIATESQASIAQESLRERFETLEQAIRPVSGPLIEAEARALRRFLILAKLGVAVLKGFVVDILRESVSSSEQQAYDKLNALDLRAWLRSWGADDETLDSAPVRALYDLAFAYENGDSTNPAAANIAAGVTLRFMLEMLLCYRDAPLFRMNAGMGDTVFAPLYDVLTKRGVKIVFFHRLRELAPTGDGRMIGSIRLDVQAELAKPSYQPFVVNVKGLDCWPNAPLWDQLKNGEAMRAGKVNFESYWCDWPRAGEEALKLGKHFDLVVLAVPPAVIRSVAPRLSECSAAWKAMLDHSASVPTQAFQLWLNRTTAELGWTIEPTVLTAFTEPYDSWADMSHLLKSEDWPDPAPTSIQYFCGPLHAPKELPPDPIATMRSLAEKNAQAWMQQWLTSLWPKAAGPSGTINTEVMSSYFCGNIDPSELYVQTPKGSVTYRLAPDQSGFDNLYLAGDWTRTRFSGGCVESAIESGMLAARAICGEPIDIAGHPRPS